MRILLAVLAAVVVLPASSLADQTATGGPDADVDLGLEGAGSPSNHRKGSRVLLLAGTGLPQLLHVEADLALTRGLALTGRAGTFPPVYFGASAGVLGLLPLSADGYIVPRHALGVGVEWTTIAVFINNGALSGPTRPETFTTTSGAAVSAGYLYTSDGGFHFRVMAGGLILADKLVLPPPIELRIAFGGLP